MEPMKLTRTAAGLAASDTSVTDAAIQEERVKRLQARAVYGFFPANSEGDDIVLYADESRRRVRQAGGWPKGSPTGWLARPP